MARKRYRYEEIVANLRQVEVLQSQGIAVSDAIRQVGVSELTCHRWRKDLGEDDVVPTVATDGADMYQTKMDIALGKRFGGSFDEITVAEAFGRNILDAGGRPSGTVRLGWRMYGIK